MFCCILLLMLPGVQFPAMHFSNSIVRAYLFSIWLLYYCSILNKQADKGGARFKGYSLSEISWKCHSHPSAVCEWNALWEYPFLAEWTFVHISQFRFEMTPIIFLTNQTISSVIGLVNPSCLSSICLHTAEKHRKAAGVNFVCLILKSCSFLPSLQLCSYLKAHWSFPWKWVWQFERLLGVLLHRIFLFPELLWFCDKLVCWLIPLDFTSLQVVKMPVIHASVGAADPSIEINDLQVVTTAMSSNVSSNYYNDSNPPLEGVLCTSNKYSVYSPSLNIINAMSHFFLKSHLLLRTEQNSHLCDLWYWSVVCSCQCVRQQVTV